MPRHDADPAGERGFTIIELMAALSILAIGFFALAGALGAGFKQIALGRQRQTATEAGNARIEHLRNVPFDSVAVSTAPAHSSDPLNPDYYVSSDGSMYDYSGNGDDEDLIVDTSNGQVLHIEDPVTIGATTLQINQYVTWANQPNNVKRLTVVVVYKPAAIPGASKIVRVSSLFTPGTVTVVGSTPGPNQGSPTPTPTPTPTATGPCTEDTSAPSGDFTIVSSTGSETGYTASLTVTLNMSFSDTCSPINVKFSNNGTTYGTWNTYDSSNPTVAWTLTSGDATKSVWAVVQDGIGNSRTLGPNSIVLDTTKPSVPGTLSYTVSCSGSNRTVNLSWGSSTDTNFRGYRVYMSTNSGTWTVVATLSGTTHSHTHNKGLDSVRFYIVGYDKAGNESNATNTISLAKHQCS